jgi:thiol-disulfide isomerase/thioredoxin
VDSYRTKGVVRAPELDGALAWLNVERPLSLRELRGCLVVLDFWTYCCVNCMHVQPTLRELERRHAGDPFVVIGVHSGKFSAERDPERIREAIGRYGVEHPVAVDDDMSIWSRYAIRSWPTLVVVRPDGTIAAVAPGEPELETLDSFISDELRTARARGQLATAPNLMLAEPFDHQPLLYPGKAVVLPDGRIAIADSGHHRVLLCERDGRVALTAGSGMRGHRDGPCLEAAFDDPQGMCIYDGALYVADARNHAIRRIDLASQQVSTVAGTGALGSELVSAGSYDARRIDLRSPWDLCVAGDAIVVAMAGSHQLWRFDPGAGTMAPWAGTGVEALLDGKLATSAWAQPSGLSLHGSTLYVADSETSAIRLVDLATEEVTTLVGEGLFDFGDADGDPGAAMLQHPLGVAAIDDGVLIADTYNGKIKRWRQGPEGGTITTELEGLSEPGSVAVTDDGVWLIADTNAHRIVGVREGAVSTLAVRAAPPPRRGAVEAPRSRPSLAAPSRGWFTTLLDLPPGQGLGPGTGEVVIELFMPAGIELSETAPLRVRSEVSRRSDLLLLDEPLSEAEAGAGPAQRIVLGVRVTSLSASVIEAEIVTTIDYVMCRADDHAACFPARLHLRLPVRLLSERGQPALAFQVEGPTPG